MCCQSSAYNMSVFKSEEDSVFHGIANCGAMKRFVFVKGIQALGGGSFSPPDPAPCRREGQLLCCGV